MKKKGATFLDIEALVPSQQISSPKSDEMIPISSLNSNENVLSQPLDQALKLKRNIFERENFGAMNLGYKLDSSEEDQCLSSVSDNRFDLDSAKSKTNSFAKQYNFDQRSPSISKCDNKLFSPNKKVLTGIAIDSTSLQNFQAGKSYSKLDQYQSFVQQVEIEEDKLQKSKFQQDQQETQQKAEQYNKIQGRREAKVGLNYIWTLKAFSIIRLVSRFIQQLKTKTETIKFRLLTQKIFSVIGDISSNFEFILISRQIKLKPSLFLILKYNFQKRATKYIHLYDNAQEYISKNIKVIKPDSKFKIVWDILLLLFIVLNIFYIPINISFDITTSGAFQYLFDLLPSWIFIVEILINFNTAYYDKGVMHEDRRSIVKHYLKNNFFWDLVVVIPFLMSNLNIPYVRYTLLLRLTRLAPLMESIEEMLNLEESIQVVVDLFKLVFFLILTGHFCGCAWHFVALTEHETFGTKNWLTNYEPLAFEHSWFDRYIISLYWSVITTVTVGYGDIVPVTTFERIFVIVVTLLLCGAFGYCISNIGNIFKSLSDKKTTYKFKLRQIHQHIRKRGLNINLSLKVKVIQTEVKKYFEYYFKLEQEEESNAEEFISQLTKHLREEVLTDLYSNTLRKSRFLRDNFNESTINNLCQFVKEKKVLPEEVLYSRSDQPTKIWFVVSGALEYVADHKNESDCYEASETYLRKVTQGAVCGEREFITQQPYEYKARAIKFTQMACIDYADFIEVISENTLEYETFCMKRDSLLFNPEYKGSGNVCEICEWTHNFIQCPFVFLQPNKNKIANSFTSVKLNKRIKFPYRSSRKSRCKSSLSDIQEEALRIIISKINDQEYTDEYLVALGFQLVLNQNESPEKQQESQSEISEKSPTISDNNALQKNIRKIAGITTDLRESHDLEVGNKAKKTMINFKRIKFGKEKTKAVKNNENSDRTSELLDSQILPFTCQQNQVKKIQFKDQHLQARRASNFDDLGIVQISQKFGSDQFGQTEDLNNCYIKEFSRNSDVSELAQTDAIKQRIEIQEKKYVNADEQQRKKKKKITVVGGGKKGSFLKQQTTTHNLSPTMQAQLRQQQFQQLQMAFDQKHKRSSFADKTNQPAYTTHLTSSGLIEKTAELPENGDIDSLQSKILDIVHSSISFHIDSFKQTIAYYPDFNIDVIAQKIQSYYDSLKCGDKKQISRTKSNKNLFQRIKPLKVTLKTLQNNSKSNVSIQKNDEIQ